MEVGLETTMLSAYQVLVLEGVQRLCTHKG